MEDVKNIYRKFKLSKLAKIKPSLDWEKFIVIEADPSKNPYKEIDFAEGLRKVCCASTIHSIVRPRPSKSNIAVVGFDSAKTVAAVLEDNLEIKGLTTFTCRATSAMNTAMLILTSVPAQITNEEIERQLEPYAKVLKITYKVLGEEFSHVINGVRKVLLDISQNANAERELPRKIVVKGYSISVHPTRTFSGQRKVCLKCGRLNHKRKSNDEQLSKTKKPKVAEKNASQDQARESVDKESSKTASSDVSDLSSSEEHSVTNENVSDEQSGKQNDASVVDAPAVTAVPLQTIEVEEELSEKPNDSFAVEPVPSRKIKVEREELGNSDDSKYRRTAVKIKVERLDY